MNQEELKQQLIELLAELYKRERIVSFEQIAETFIANCLAIQKNAYWKTREDKNDYLWVECSNCGFMVENYKAVELGCHSTDVIGYKYHSCPICTAKMVLPTKEVV